MIKIRRESWLFIVISAISVFAILWLIVLASHLQRAPYMQRAVYDISEDWTYLDKAGRLCPLANLEAVPIVAEHEVFTLQKTLETPIAGAALMITRNHQAIRLRLDGVIFFAAGVGEPGQNPGMELHLIPLPEEYLGKTLVMEVSSPYPQYAGRLNPVRMGDILSLEAYAAAHSMQSVILMSICVFLGLSAIVLSILHAWHDRGNWSTLSMGVFAVVWGLYYICTEPIAYQFLDPVQMSLFSIGLYFALPAPLTLFFYFSSQRLKPAFLLSACMHCGFLLVAVLLQATGMIPFVRLLNVNNLIYFVGLTYLIALCVAEIRSHNRAILLSAPFVMVAYLSIAVEFVCFYTTRKPVNYIFFKNAFTLMVLSSLGLATVQFFERYYTKHMEADLLALQSRLAMENYRQIQDNIDQTRLLKHEMNGHLSVLRLFLEHQEYMRADTYLNQVLLQAERISKIRYCKHFLVNAMMCRMAEDAVAKGIELNLQVNVPEQVEILDWDLHSLLSNITTNAIDACVAVEAVEKRSIQLSIGVRDLYFIISCQNSRNPAIKLDRALSSTKMDVEHHGYGMRIIENIVKKYDGTVSHEVGNRHFKISLALKQEGFSQIRCKAQ